MKKSFMLIVAAFFLIALFTGNTLAQDDNDPTMFLIWEEHVPPSKMAEFWQVQSEALKKMDELKFDDTFSAYYSDQNSIYWVMPLQNFGSIDVLFEKMEKNYEILLENNYDPTQKFRDLTTASQFVIYWNKELSFQKNMPEKAEPDKFHRWTFFYLKSGHEKEAIEANKKYQDFYNGTEETYNWNMYQVMLGNRTPCWIMHVSAESEMALLKHERDLVNKHEQEFQKLWQNIIQHVDKTEIKKGWYLPDWSR